MSETLISDTQIQIPRKLTNQLLHFAQLSPDREICGLIGGKNRTPTTCYPIINVAENSGQRFLLDAKQQIDAMSQMRGRGETLFAIYHSHPSTPPLPSLLDVEQSAYPDAIYLIISLNIKGVLEMRGFEINHQKVTELPLALIEE